MWNYTKCTVIDREEKLNKLGEAFQRDTDCLKYLSEVQRYIHSTQTTLVLLQDLDANILIEMDYIPVNNYIFHVVSIEENGIKKRGLGCKTMKQATNQFMMRIETKSK